MSVSLPADDRQQAIASLKRYAEDELDRPLGDLAAGFLLDFVLVEVGPSIHNAALAEAQRHLSAPLADLDLELGKEPFPTYRR